MPCVTQRLQQIKVYLYYTELVCVPALMDTNPSLSSVFKYVLNTFISLVTPSLPGKTHRWVMKLKIQSSGGAGDLMNPWKVCLQPRGGV